MKLKNFIFIFFLFPAILLLAQPLHHYSLHPLHHQHHYHHYRILFMGATLNAVPLPFTVVIAKEDHLASVFFISQESLKKLKISVSNVKSVMIDKYCFYRIKDIPQLTASINVLDDRIDFGLPSKYLPAQHYNYSHDHFVHPHISAPGGFLNYDLFSRKQLSSHQTQQVSGLFDLGVFNRYGVGTNDFLVTNQSPNSQNKKEFIRLDTTWRIDFPGIMQTIRFGDSISNPGLWGDGVSFAGFQWKTNFSTQPYFVTFPLPSVRGLAVAPSTVDVYVNNALQRRTNVNSGPFSINHIPVITGDGNIHVVVTNVLGQQEVISTPYYAAGELLRPGLHDASVSMGILRKNYGIDSFDYSTLMAEGTDTWGVTPSLTTQIHGEVTGSRQNIGGGANILLDRLGIMTLAGAVSHSDHSHVGGLALLRFNRMSQHLNFGFSTQYATGDFRLLSSERGRPPSKWENSLFVGTTIFHHTSVGLAYINQQNRFGAHANIISLSLSRVFFHRLSASVSAIDNLSGVRNKGVYVNFTLPLGRRTYASSDVDYEHHHGGQASVSITKNLPVGSGYGYRLRASTGHSSNHYLSSEVSYQTHFGTYHVGFADQNNTHAYQLEARGGLTLLDGSVGLTRQVTQAFGIVELPGFPNIPVYWQNHVIGHTNKAGYVWVPNMNAYSYNKISIDPNTLPWGAEVTADSIHVVPYYRSGVIVRFPLFWSRAGLMKIRLANGKPLPLGAQVTLLNTGQRFPVGHGGQLYFTNLQRSNTLRIQWHHRECKIHFTIDPHSKEPYINIGTYQCDLR